MTLLINIIIGAIQMDLCSALVQVDRRHLQLGEQEVALGTQWPQHDVQGVHPNAARVIERDFILLFKLIYYSFTG